MAQPALTLVRPGGAPPAAKAGAPRLLALAALLAGAAVLASAGGADAARERFEPQELVVQALERSLDRGNEDPEVRRLLLRLRGRLAWRPLDSGTRSAYSALLLGVSRRVADTHAAVFHSRVAAELAPVTVPVVRTAARVLFRAGEVDEALDWIRRMFLYDPTAAANLLFEQEPLLTQQQVEATVPDDPDAWLGWSLRLRSAGLDADAARWITEGVGHWPEHSSLLWQAAALATWRGDWAELERLLPADRELPERPATALVLPYRARLRFQQGNVEGARSDLRGALELDGENATVLVLVGNTFSAIGAHREAVEAWNRALFRMPASHADQRRSVLLSLARLTDAHGNATEALLRWRAVLELDPGHQEARRRVDDLTGFRR